MKALHNEQYTQFIINHVIKPYQSKIMDGKANIKTLCFNSPRTNTEFNYECLINLIDHNPEWWELVIDRLSRIYTKIDFSFFPDERFAHKFKKALYNKGVAYWPIYFDR